MELFLALIFLNSESIRRFTEYRKIQEIQNAGKYGPEITPYLDTFHAATSTLYECKFFSKIYFDDILSYIGIREPTCIACQLISLYMRYRVLS